MLVRSTKSGSQWHPSTGWSPQLGLQSKGLPAVMVIFIYHCMSMPCISRCVALIHFITLPPPLPNSLSAVNFRRLILRRRQGLGDKLFTARRIWASLKIRFDNDFENICGVCFRVSDITYCNTTGMRAWSGLRRGGEMTGKQCSNFVFHSFISHS